MVAAGKDVEDTMGHIGRFYGAISDLSECKKRADNPPLFKKLVDGKSVNEEAMHIFAQQKKAQKLEKELRELLTMRFGPSGWKELIALRRKVREDRERTIYLQERRRKALFWNSIQGTAILILSIAAYQMYAFLFEVIISANS
jgi:hypothetical protein